MRNLAALPDLFPCCRIAVIGDLMLDEYLWGHIERISPEAPVPILNVVRRTSTLGGAGNVVENLRSLGASVTVLGVVGEDHTGSQICDLLRQHGADVQGVISDTGRKSTRKSRLMSLEHGQQVFRLDEESAILLDPAVESRIIEATQRLGRGIQALVCSDYLKGVLSKPVLTSIFAVARDLGIRTIVAPKDSDAEKYRGADILMPNARELMQLSGEPANGASSFDGAARGLIEKLSLEALVVTRGSEGMSLFQRSPVELQRTDIATAARSVYDVTGAGDTAIAAFSAALCAGADLRTAAELANITAGIKVGKRGTASVDLDEIRLALQDKP